MTTYYVTENNSGGYTVALDCGIDHNGRPQVVCIEAHSEREAIAKFEHVFDVDWDYQNSYEGGSCNCCGRRFYIETDSYQWRMDKFRKASIVDGKLVRHYGEDAVPV